MYSSPPALPHLSAKVMVRGEIQSASQGRLLGYKLQLEDGTELEAVLWPEEDDKVYGMFDDVLHLVGLKKTVYIRVAPLNIIPVKEEVPAAVTA